LRAIAGLETIDSGRIVLDGRVVSDGNAKQHVRPEYRCISMLFQSYALWPLMTIEWNVRYPLTTTAGRKARLNRASRTDEVKRALEMVGILELARQYPGQASGGQQQRAALARALVTNPDVILFDEPLSNVDAKVRQHLRSELQSLHAQLGFTAIYVTHDQDDALTLGSEIAILDGGRLAQLGTPTQVYENPESEYVMRFTGITNELPGVVVHVNGDGRADANTPAGVVSAKHPPNNRPAVDDKVRILSRPEQWRFATPDEPTGIRGTISSARYMGFYWEYTVTSPDLPSPVEMRSLATSGGELRARREIGADVSIALDSDGALICRPDTGR
jgi:iron(III) transport system ATP-binding protein